MKRELGYFCLVLLIILWTFTLIDKAEWLLRTPNQTSHETILMTVLTMDRSKRNFNSSMNMNRDQQQQHYIYATINSFFNSSFKTNNFEVSELHLMLGSPDEDYVNMLETNSSYSKNLIIHKLTPKEKLIWQQLHGKPRATFNYLRALEALTLHQQDESAFSRHLSKSYDDTKGVLILEDDIIFRERFEKRLLETIKEIEQRGFTRFAVNCYVVEWSRYYRSLRPSGVHFYRSWGFCCTQCMYFSKEAAHIISKDFSNLLYQSHISHVGYDILLDDLQNQGKFIIFNMKEPIVQHVGEVSSGLSNNLDFHQGKWNVNWQSNRSHYLKFDLNT